MSTPAIDYRSYLTEPNWYLRDDYLVAGGVKHYRTAYGDNPREIKERHRPKSVSNRKDDLGWRNPSSYYSFVESAVANGFQAIREYPQNELPYTVKSRIETYIGAGFVNFEIAGIGYDENLVSRTEIKTLLKLKDQNVNFGVAFAEAGEVAELFTDTAHQVASFVKGFRRKDPKGFARARLHQGQRKTGQFAGRGPLSRKAEEVPGKWLEYQYGIAPLVNDVQGAYKALSNKTSLGQPFTCTVKGALMSTYGLDFNRAWNISSAGQTIGWLDLNAEVKNFCACELTYTLNSPVLATASSLGLTNPLEVIWERVPFSFLVDQLLPIGSSLSALDADFGWDFKAGTNTLGYTLASQGVNRPNPNYPGGPWLILGSVRQRAMEFRRIVYVTPPRFRLPQFKNPISLGHVANAASLLVQAFR